MFWVVVVLEYDSEWIEVVPSNRFTKFVFENGQIEVLVHFVVDFAHVTRTPGYHAAPDHNRTTAMFDSLFDMPVL